MTTPERKPELWAIAGLPGSGKTTHAEALAKDQSAEVFSRDQVRTETLDKEKAIALLTKFFLILGLEDNFRSAVAHKASRYLQPKLNQAKAIAQEILPYLQVHGHNIRRGEHLKAKLEKVLQLNDVEAYACLFGETEDWADIFGLLGNKQMVDQAVVAVRTQKDTYIDHPDFIYRCERRVLKNYVEQNGISPSIIIVQATRKQILKVEKSRPDAEKMRRDIGDIDTIIAQAEPYNRLEEFGKVVVVNRKIARDIEQVRELMRTAGSRGPEKEVGFLLGASK